MSSPINFNGIIHEDWPPDLLQIQRGWYYADTLFETIRYSEKRIAYFEQHIKRLLSGLQVLDFKVPELWSTDFFRAEIARILPSETHDFRIRLTVWRAPGGLYLATDHTPQFAITAQPLNTPFCDPDAAALSIGICPSVRLPIDQYSALKTLNAPRYAIAARFAQQHGFDDALLLNSADRICEATSSNIFWWQNEILYTVPLSEGCVAGIMRNKVLETAQQNGIAVREFPLEPALLRTADAIFLTNAIRGIVPVSQVTITKNTIAAPEQTDTAIIKYDYKSLKIRDLCLMMRYL